MPPCTGTAMPRLPTTSTDRAAPHDKPEVAGVVFTENSEHGYLGAPIAKHVLETYFAKKEGRPLPVLTPPKAPPAAAPTRAVADAALGTGGGR